MEAVVSLLLADVLRFTLLRLSQGLRWLREPDDLEGLRIGSEGLVMVFKTETL